MFFESRKDREFIDYQLPILYKELMSVVYKKEQKVITKTSEGI